MALGEVRAAAAVWKDGRMTLRWEPPGAATVVIFRRRDQAPSVRSGASGPEPADPTTAQVYRGGGTSWVVPRPGRRGYLPLPDCGRARAGSRGRGVEVQAAVPVPPPPVPTVTASHVRQGERDAVLVEWTPHPSSAPVEYLVVRRTGSTPVGRPEEGTLVQSTPQGRILDARVILGHRYTYTVFSRQGELLSRTGTRRRRSSPERGLGACSSDRQWHGGAVVDLHRKVSTVIVRRSLAVPRDATHGTLGALNGPCHARDEGLHNGQRYHYLVVRLPARGPPGGLGPNSRIAAVPEALPESVADFSAHAEGPDVVCTWTPPRHGQVVVLRSTHPHGFQPGDRLGAAAVDPLGERVYAVVEGRAIDSRPEAQKPYYSSFTVAGSHAVAGGTAACVACPDVADLQVAVVFVKG